MSQRGTTTSSSITTIPVAWGEQDAFGHVNNVVYFRWFETARIAWFRAVGWTLDASSDRIPVLARTDAVYRAPIVHPDTVDVSVTCTHLGVDRMTLLHRVYSRELDQEAAFGTARVVCVAADGSGKRPLPDAVARRIVELSDDDLVLEGAA